MKTREMTNDQALILIAEDDPDDQLMLQDAFEESCRHCELRFVCDGVELLDCLTVINQNADSQLPDLLLLDLNMPLKDGRQALLEIRANPAFSTLPVVVMTTSKSDEDRTDCLAEGANDYLVKPTTYRELLTTVQSLKTYWKTYD
ncbi:MAG: response regulator [Pseudomonadota bacterium]